MNRTALRTAALGGVAALGLLLSAPAASAQPATIDYGITSVSSPTIAPGSSGTVDIVVTNLGTGTSNLPARVALDVRDPLRALPCDDPNASCTVIVANLGPGQSTTVSRGVAVQASAAVGAQLGGLALLTLPDDQNPTNDGRLVTVRTAGVVPIPLVEPLIGATAVLLVLAAGGVALHRRSRVGSEARN